MKEIEIKLKYKSKEQVISILKQLGATKSSNFLLKDT